jgi:hypothetical protein
VLEARSSGGSPDSVPAMRLPIALGLSLVVGLGGAAGCRTGGTEMKIPRRPSRQVEELVRTAKASELVFVGTVLSTGEPPSYSSGMIPAYQEVTYRVGEVLKGRVAQAEVTVSHVVVEDSATAEPGDVPELSRSLFAKGNRLLVFAVRGPEDAWVGWNDLGGAVPYNADALRSIRSGLAD